MSGPHVITPSEFEELQRYRQARDLCGGEDPVDCLTRIAEATRYDPNAEKSCPLSEWVRSGREARDAQIARAEHDAKMWREEAKRTQKTLDVAHAVNRGAGAAISRLDTDRSVLLDLVQRLLDENKGLRSIMRTALTELRSRDNTDDPSLLRELVADAVEALRAGLESTVTREARAMVAELRPRDD